MKSHLMESCCYFKGRNMVSQQASRLEVGRAMECGDGFLLKKHWSVSEMTISSQPWLKRSTFLVQIA